MIYIQEVNPFYMNSMIRFLLLSVLSMPWVPVCAQNYNFTFAQSQTTYAALNTSSVMNGRDWSNRRVHIPIGFHFTYQGQGYDSLKMLPEGEVGFVGGSKNAIMLLKGLRYKSDASGNFSQIKIQTTGNTGQRICELEFSGTGLDVDPAEYVNVQLWLYEQNGAVELHYGPNSYGAAKDSANMPLVGPINWMMNGSKNGFVLSGNPQKSTVTGNQITSMSDLKFLVRIPDSGTVFTLVPSN
jgi:hypothetical protein